MRLGRWSRLRELSCSCQVGAGSHEGKTFLPLIKQRVIAINASSDKIDLGVRRFLRGCDIHIFGISNQCPHGLIKIDDHRRSGRSRLASPQLIESPPSIERRTR